MRILTAVLCSLILSSAAFAEDVQVKTPLGQTITGKKAMSPAADSVEGVVITSLKMIRDGKFDAWMDTHCHPSHCALDKTQPHYEANRASMKNYNLTASSKSAGHCLHDEGKSIIVTRQDGDPATDAKVTVYIFCGEKRMPTPSTLEKDGDSWKVSSFSW